ncbi:MAG: hypothetical protein IH614_11735 [Desulfuromonadales bacterium]|nr:hypothetical protein [Desulfuromonadales bacterium]
MDTSYSHRRSKSIRVSEVRRNFSFVGFVVDSLTLVDYAKSLPGDFDILLIEGIDPLAEELPQWESISDYLHSTDHSALIIALSDTRNAQILAGLARQFNLPAALLKNAPAILKRAAKEGRPLRDLMGRLVVWNYGFSWDEVAELAA